MHAKFKQKCKNSKQILTEGLVFFKVKVVTKSVQPLHKIIKNILHYRLSSNEFRFYLLTTLRIY